MNGQAEIPMSDHIKRFWELLATEHVRILIDIRRDHDEEQPPHWDSASFPDDVAKALVAQRTGIIEDCAKVCFELRREDFSVETEDWITGTADCAKALRKFAAAPSS